MVRTAEKVLSPLTAIKRSIYQEHLDEAAFLWAQWRYALDSPKLTLGDLCDGDERRLRAHVDALALGGEAALEELVVPALADPDEERVTAAALALGASGDEAQLRKVVSVLASCEPAQRSCLQRALEVCTSPARVLAVLELLEAEESAVVASALELLSFWGIGAGTKSSELLAHPVPEVAAAALSSMRVAPGPVEYLEVLRALESEHKRIRDEALITAVALRLEPAWARCRQLASLPSDHSQVAMLLLAQGGDASDLRILQEQLGRVGPDTDALWALGFSGRREAAETCLALLTHPRLGRLAAEAFCAITGLTLHGPLSLAENESQGDLEVLEPQEEDEARIEEKHLPLANPEHVLRWWRETQHSLEAKGRYLLGRPLRADWLVQSFEHVPLRRRHPWGLEVMLRSQGEHFIQTRAFSCVQRAQVRVASTSIKQWGNLEQPFRTLPARTATRDRRPPVKSLASPSALRSRKALASPRALAVTGIGLVSVLGEDVVSACAAGHAGVRRIAPLEGTHVFDPTTRAVEPASGHAVHWVTHGFEGLGRLIALGAAGMQSLERTAQVEHWDRTALYVTTSNGLYARLLAEQSGNDFDDKAWARSCSQQLVPGLLKELRTRSIPVKQKVFFGEEGFFHSLQEASEQLWQGRVDHCIVGGVDSLVDPSTVRALDDLRLLKTPSNPVGFLPGEAAAFLQLEIPNLARQRKHPIHALLEVPCIKAEPYHRKSRQPAAGTALAGCIAGAISGRQARGEQVGLIVAGLNGDAYRAHDWGCALVRLRAERLLPENIPEWYSALLFGEVGAASGPVGVAIAAQGFARGHCPSECVLLWVGGDCGSRCALCIHAPEEFQV